MTDENNQNNEQNNDQNNKQNAEQNVEQNAEQNAPQGQQPPKGTIRVRNAVLVFLKDVATPMVLYFDNAQKVYQDLKTVINSTEIRMVEFEPLGPIKKAAVLSDKIVSVALQEERYLTQE